MCLINDYVILTHIACNTLIKKLLETKLKDLWKYLKAKKWKLGRAGTIHMVNPSRALTLALQGFLAVGSEPSWMMEE